MMQLAFRPKLVSLSQLNTLLIIRFCILTCFTVVMAWCRASPTDEKETLEERQADMSSKVCNATI